MWKSIRFMTAEFTLSSELNYEDDGRTYRRKEEGETPPRETAGFPLVCRLEVAGTGAPLEEPWLPKVDETCDFF